ncbi:MAG: CdaR family protein [Patescibacteria group bacterium]|nr:CdaR family protein [Patescibacteria group bacterium]
MSNSFYLKILAVVSAIFLWFFVINEGFQVNNLDTEIQIKVHNLSEDLMITNDLSKVKLKLRAPTDVWQKKDIASKINASIDLQYYDQGEYDVEVKVETLDKSIQIIEQEPESVHVILAPIVSTIKQVELETSGNLGKDYIADKPRFSQPEVNVESAQVVLDKIVKVVAPIKYDNEMLEIKKNVELEARDKDNKKINKVNIVPKTIEVIIPISKENGEKTVGVRANIIGNLPAGATIEKIETNPSTVIIKGKNDKIKDLDTVETNSIDLGEMTEDVNAKTVGLDLPDGIEALDNPQITVKVYLSQEKITKSFQGIIKYKNLNDQFKVGGIMPSRIQLTIEGPSAKINSLNEDEVYFEVDLTSKGEGTFDFAVNQNNVTVPSGISIKSVETKTIKVIIAKK